MITSGYTIGLNCDVCGWSKDELGGSDNPAHIWRAVKKSGWKISRKYRTCICAECISNGKKLPINQIGQDEPFAQFGKVRKSE